MTFNDIDFILFFVPVLLIFYLLNTLRNNRAKNLFLLISCYVFYGLFEIRMLLVLLFVTLVNFTTIRTLLSLPQTKEKDRKRIYVITTDIIVSLLPLFIFKYLDFFLTDVFGVQDHLFDKMVLPVGISFFTFQALSYSIDVYRGKEKDSPSLLNYCLFVSFFPCILSGPIERARTLMPQIRSFQYWNVDIVINGFQLFVWGLFQKIVVADRIAEYVGYVYSHPTIYGTTTILLAMSLYSIQIYCDFAGYSNMAIGVGRMLGFDIRKNFDFPYFSTTIRSFWKKWHISLTSWFTEYVYISLGGNRVGEYRWIANVLIVFLVSGLWHGAAWTFIIWGALHGVYQIIEHYVLGKGEFSTWWGKLVSGICLFFIVSVAWVFFRADNFDHAINILTSLGNLQIPLFKMFTTEWMIMWTVLLFGVIIEILLKFDKVRIIEYSNNPVSVINLSVCSILILVIALFGKNGASFVYFQF